VSGDQKSKINNPQSSIPMTITFDITEEEAAHIWEDHYRTGSTRTAAAAEIAAIAKAYLESESRQFRKSFPFQASTAAQAFQSLPDA
jgi:hypothetical protein